MPHSRALVHVPGTIETALLNGDPIRFGGTEPPKDRTIDPAWVLAAVLACKPVVIDHAIFSTTLKLDGLAIGRLEITNSDVFAVGIRYSRASSVVSLEGCRVAQSVSLRGTSVAGALLMQDMTIGVDVDLSEARVDLTLALNGTEVVRNIVATNLFVGRNVLADDKFKVCGLNFQGSTFQGQVQFIGSTLAGSVIITDAAFGGSVLFQGLVLCSAFIAERAQIGGSLYFRDVTFSAASTFRQLKCGQFLGFENVHCSEPLDIERSRINGSLAIVGTTLSCGLALPGTRIDDCLEIRTTKVNGEARLDGADIGATAQIRSTTFEGKAYFDRLTVGQSLVMGELPDHGEVAPRVRFRAHVSLNDAVVGSQFQVSSVDFADTVSFEGMTVKSSVFLEDLNATAAVSMHFLSAERMIRVNRSVFVDTLHISNTKSRSVLISSSELTGKLDLSGLESDECILTNVLIQKILDMSNARIRGNLLLGPVRAEMGLLATGMRIDGAFELNGLVTSTIDMRNSVVRRLVFASVGSDRTAAEYEAIDLRGADYQMIDGDWTALLQRQRPFDQQPFRRLETVYRAAARDDDSRRVYIERQKQYTAALQQTYPLPAIFARRIWGWTTGYGASFARTLAAYAVVWVVSIAFFACIPSAAAHLNLPRTATSVKSYTCDIRPDVFAAADLAGHTLLPIPYIGDPLWKDGPCEEIGKPANAWQYGTSAITLILRLCGFALGATLASVILGFLRVFEARKV
ncbi:MAG: hypothetical protein JWM87_3952 [Candidatus Eremiobacteraeota bacterium]|nr:hypothetical protein [Candidatus Eremiobacteraeota bacterium]